jgi:hypothetical protein
MDNEDRKTASRLLAKALAYKDCGKQTEANEHASALVQFLAQLGIRHDAFNKVMRNKNEN